MARVGILNVGRELLAGTVSNSNATWLAKRVTDSGMTVDEIRVVPDEVASIEAAVADFAARFDRSIVTGGLGSTPDDVTLEAVAGALDRPLEANAVARADIEESVDEIQVEYPEFDHDTDRGSQFPVGARIVPNGEGIVPGCVVENVYVLPGIPDEMRAVFERVAGEFAGDVRTRTVISYTPESHLNPLLTELHDRFEVEVGCYPTDDRKRITVSGSDPEELEQAYDWLRARPEVDDEE